MTHLGANAVREGQNQTMLIVLDTSAVAWNPRFEAFVRTAIGQGARVVVPRLVLLELIHRCEQESAAMIEALTVRSRMYDRLGLRENLTQFVDAARAKAKGYAEEVAGELEGLGIDIVEPVDSSHVEIALRAVRCRRPYLDRKRHDGYPDTVNWLTVLNLADRNPADEVVWVSANSRAFGSGETSMWHDEIWAELHDRGLERRVRWAVDLADVSLAEKKFAEAEHPRRDQLVEPASGTPVLPAAPVPDPLGAPTEQSVSADEQVAVVLPPSSPVQVERPRVPPQRIQPPDNANRRKRRGLARIIGGRKRTVTVVEELDDLDLGQ
ncbi:PIN domain-containing protein [Rhodococcus marinonascens]|uniref:PIN domain-containing protein n=1 Tax=Rhodococcus marinonascens TaxID=38311 RepID=UPI000A71D9CB|nr:PIN domain-containing protein [Rhodococcus marinonascens]